MSTKNHFGSINSYILGFVLSLLTTLGSYFLVTSNILENSFLITAVLTLAVAQLIVQLFFFLHLGQEKKPHWQLMFFIATVGIILLVVVGSIWIMHHLNYNMMPTQMDQFLLKDEGMQK